MEKLLQPGNYMNCQSVLGFIKRWFPSKLNEILSLQKHEGEYGTYYSATDIKTVLTPNIFKDMQCDVTTYMILQNQ